jgi:hypothetical protein
MRNKLCSVLALLMFSTLTPAATTYHFSDCGYVPNDGVHTNLAATQYDACNLTGSDGVLGYTGCRLCETPSAAGGAWDVDGDPICGVQITLTGDGGTNQMSPSSGSAAHYTYVDEYAGNGDTDYLKMVGGNVELYTVDASGIPGGATITAVSIYSYFASNSSGTTGVQVGFSFNGTPSYGAQCNNSSTSYAGYRTTWLTNPSTSSAWVKSDLTAATFKIAVKATSVPMGIPKPKLSAVDVYVSTTTGSPVVGTNPTPGSPVDPWCLDPTASGTRDPFTFLQDGVNNASNPELTAGDTIKLCAGSCDGSGSATWYLQPMGGGGSHADYLIDTATQGPLTIKPYTGETVTWSGDSDGDLAVDTGEVGGWIVSHRAPAEYWDLEGDPGNTGSPHWFLTRTTGQPAFNLAGDIGDYDGAHHITLNRLDISRNVACMWPSSITCDNSPNSGNPCDSDSAYLTWADNMGAGPFTFTNNNIHDWCSIVHRHNNNYTSGNDSTFTNNHYTNVGAVGTWDNFTGQNSSATVAIASNVVSDSGGAAISNNMQHVTIDDNTFTCPGIYGSVDYVGCPVQIMVDNGRSPNCEITCNGGSDAGAACADTDGSARNDWCDSSDCSGAPDCWSDDIKVRRNLIVGTARQPYNDPQLGVVAAGVVLRPWYDRLGHSDTSFPTALLAENNIVINAYTRNSGWDDNIGDAYDFMNGSIVLGTHTNGAVVRNNTVLNGRNCLLVSGESNASMTATVTDNLLYGCTDDGLVIQPSASHVTFQNNDVDGGSVTVNSTSYNCSQVNSTPALGLANGSGNICAAASFVACQTGAPYNLPSGTTCHSAAGNWINWDAHLYGAQACVDGGVSAAANDFDLQSRPIGNATDIGADEK